MKTMWKIAAVVVVLVGVNLLVRPLRIRIDMTDDQRQLVDVCARYTKNFTCRLRMAFSPKYRLTYGTSARRLYWKLRILSGKI